MASISDSNHNDGAILWPTLRVAAAAGAAGLLFGGTVGILRSPTPFLWASVSSIQWAFLGGSYWGIRSTFLNTRREDEITPETNIYASAFAGGLSAAGVGAITRGRANVIPGTIMGTLTGYLGQKGYNMIDEKHTETLASHTQTEPFWRRLADSKFSPVKVLSDKEYESMLMEKLLKVNAEIAVIDDDIFKLKEAQRFTDDSQQHEHKEPSEWH